jgi:hypothetical protein
MTKSGEAARRAIEDLVSDASASPEETLQDLMELFDDLGVRIEALQAELDSGNWGGAR